MVRPVVQRRAVRSSETRLTNGSLFVPIHWSDTNASSALVLTLPARGITLILVANSDGLAKPASLAAGDVTVSPFARVFLGLVVK